MSSRVRSCGNPPFLIAFGVRCGHAAATFLSAIYESVEWWLWFVLVGIAVVVFAARFGKAFCA
jgi:hypothetical protein